MRPRTTAVDPMDVSGSAVGAAIRSPGPMHGLAVPRKMGRARPPLAIISEPWLMCGQSLLSDASFFFSPNLVESGAKRHVTVQAPVSALESLRDVVIHARKGRCTICISLNAVLGEKWITLTVQVAWKSGSKRSKFLIHQTTTSARQASSKTGTGRLIK